MTEVAVLTIARLAKEANPQPETASHWPRIKTPPGYESGGLSAVLRPQAPFTTMVYIAAIYGSTFSDMFANGG